MEIGQMFLEALKLMGIGVGMVFAVLGIFYVLIKALMILLPAKVESKPEE